MTTCGTPCSSEARWPAEVGVPGVRVHQVGAGAAVGDRQVDAEGAQGGVGAGELGEVGVRRGAASSRGAPKACTCVVDVVAGAQRADQLGDVHAGAAVHLGRVLLGQDVDAHVPEPTRRRGLTMRSDQWQHDRHATEGARDRPRRWGGQAADAADRGPGQAGGAVRRHLPADRLRAVERRELRLPAGGRADAVQVAQPGPARHPDLADVDDARQLRRRRCRRSSGSASTGTSAARTRSTSRST